MGLSLKNFDKNFYIFDSPDGVVFPRTSWVEPIYVIATKVFCMGHKCNAVISNLDDAPAGYMRTILQSEADSSKSYIPVTPVSLRSTRGVNDNLSAIIANKISESHHFKDKRDETDFNNYLQYMLSEMMNNIIDHSLSPVDGYAAAQYFPNYHTVQVVVADFGVGFLETLGRNYSSLSSEADAIEKALEFQTSGTQIEIYGKEKNAGVGLYVLRKMLQHLNGYMKIVSNDTIATIDQSGVSFYQHPTATAWKGSIVAFEFKEQDISYEFNHIMNNIRAEAMEGDEEEIF